MKNPISFFVPGIPATSGSKSAYPYKNKKTGRMGVAVAPASKRQKSWMGVVRFFAEENYNGDVLAGPISLSLVFYLPRPKSHFGTGRNAGKLKPSARKYPTTTPDLTKLVRAVEDALKGVTWKDDSQVVYQLNTKFYRERPGVEVTIRDL